jgi:hypothetical protein
MGQGWRTGTMIDLTNLGSLWPFGVGG